MTSWKADIRYLREANAEQDKAMLSNNEQMSTILISMMPEPIKDYLVTKYEEGETTYDQLETTLLNYLAKKDQSEGMKKKFVGAVMPDDSTESEEWRETWDASGNKHWVCTAKRQRTDDPDQGGAMEVDKNEERKAPYEQYEAKARLNLINKIFQSHDNKLNQKYNVELNKKTIERVKNSF